MTNKTVFLLVCAAISGSTLATMAKVETRANPIRKVVSMLQAMQKKVSAEGVTETELYDKFMCYCKNSNGDLAKSISLAEAKVPEVGSAISEAEAKLAQTKEGLKQAQVDRSAAEDSMAKAKALREKEAADFAKVESELSTNIAALGKAIAALEKSMAGAFIQSAAAVPLRRLVVDREELSDFDRQMISSFLDATQGYVPQSGQITGILKQLKDTMSAELETATASESSSIASFEELMAAKKKEKASLTKAIEIKTEQIGELGVEIVTLKADLDDTQKALLEDKGFLENLDKNCATKTTEHEENMALRAQELVALADTIKILNDDDALELFKKTLPAAGSASFLQEQETMASQRIHALELIQAEKKRTQVNLLDMNFLVLALKGKKVSFAKVLKMIDEMVVILGKEQDNDDHQKEYCLLSFDQQEDNKKGLEGDLSQLGATIDHEKEGVATMAEEIAALEAGIVELDKSVAEATANRQEESADFKSLMAEDAATKELLDFAKNRLNKFYNPALYKAPPTTTLSVEDKLSGLASFVQVSAHRQSSDRDDVAPPPPPETAAAYAKKSESSAGVITMIDMLIKDLDKEMTEAKTAETEAQADYETTMSEAATKRATDAKSLADKESAKAALSADLLKHEGEKTSTTKTLMATEEVIAGLHSECDWLLQNFETRKEARAGEVESLKKAKDVLSGADYSLAQLRSTRRLRSPGA